jgi:L-ascorbate 6-phosphate lactonase
MLNILSKLEVPHAGLAVMALGQAGFAFKDKAGNVVVIDPCLGDPVAKISPGRHRLYPPPLQPENLCCDVLVCTHDHLDHLDPETIGALAEGAVKYFAGPGNVCRHLLELGIKAEKIRRVDASQTIAIGNIRITGVMAITNDPQQPDAEGIILQMEDVPLVYHTGDTAFHPLLGHVAKSRPQIVLPCINGRYGNMDAYEAAVLCALLRPCLAIPHHYDMFRDNLADPNDFAANLKWLAPESKCVILKPGESRLFS